MWMLDTNVCIDAMRHRKAILHRKFAQVGWEQITISAVALSELYYGAARYPNRPDYRHEIDSFITLIYIVPWDIAAADAYGHIRSELERLGTVSGNNDMMIAAHAISRNAVLVTSDTKHFSLIHGLKLENWI